LEGGSACRKAATYTQDNINRISAHTDIQGFEAVTPVFEWAKSVQALDYTATETGN
jgi:hypothetical protein